MTMSAAGAAPMITTEMTVASLARSTEAPSQNAAAIASATCAPIQATSAAALHTSVAPTPSGLHGETGLMDRTRAMARVERVTR